MKAQPMHAFLRAAVATSLALLVPLSAAAAEEHFKPQLQKVVVNGQVLLDLAAKVQRTPLTVDTSALTTIECTFANLGDRPAEDAFMVFLHVAVGETVVGGDYGPAIATTGWVKGKTYTDAKAIDLSKLQGQQVTLYVGLFHGENRFSLVNPGEDYQQRQPAGTLTLTAAKEPKEAKGAAKGAKP